MKRRDALKSLGGLAGLFGLTKFLPACKDAQDEPVGITTYVYLMMENRSYDHYLGGRALEGLGGDGVTADMSNPDAAGTPVRVHPATSTELCDPDPPHSWDAAHSQWSAGTNTGFLTEYQARHPAGTEVMKYMTREQLPVTWALADQYTVCDRWFASVMGPTWPNRFYWHTGQSNGIRINEVPSYTLSWPSMVERLGEAGIEWTHYYANITVASLLPATVPTEGRVRLFKEFFADAKAGTLPQVCYVEPGYFLNDDHPPLHPINGQELIAAVYRALAQSPQWKHCMLVVAYDEHGGYFDHVAPPKTADDFAAQGFDQLGFRVPTLVVGPYVKSAHVSSVQYDHTSALKQLQVTYGLDPLTARMAAANDLADCIDMERLARGDWAEPIEIPIVDVDAWAMGAECQRGARVAPGPGECAMHDWANANPDLVAAYDRRGREDEYLADLRAFLREAQGTPVYKPGLRPGLKRS